MRQPPTRTGTPCRELCANGRPNSAARCGSGPALHTYGYTDAQILETVLMVGLAKFSNFVAFGLGTVPDFDPSQAILARAESASSGRVGQTTPA